MLWAQPALSPLPSAQATGSQSSHFLHGETDCRSSEGFGQQKGHSLFSIRASFQASSHL